MEGVIRLPQLDNELTGEAGIGDLPFKHTNVLLCSCSIRFSEEMCMKLITSLDDKD